MQLLGQPEAGQLRLEDNCFDSIPLASYAGLHTDPSGTLTIDDILSDSRAFSGGFETDQPTPYPTAHWLKLSVSAATAIPGKWLVFKNRSEEYRYFGGLDYVDAFFVQEGTVKARHRSGYLVPRREKPVQERAIVNVIPFSLGAGDSTTIYIRLSSGQVSDLMHIEPVLMQPFPNISYSTDQNKWAGYGGQAMYFIIGLYVLVFWFFIRHNSYLYFGIFCWLFGLHFFNIEPFYSMVDLFFPNHPHLAMPAFIISALGSMLFLLLFGRSFSEVKNRLPKWDKYLLGVTGLFGIRFLYEFISSWKEPFDTRMIGFFLAFLLILPLSIKFVLGPHRLAKIFGAGILWFLFWVMLGFLFNAGLIRLPILPWPVGQMGLLIIYALGLGYKLLENEHQKAQAERIQELDAVKSRFFANISHEFRTPLTLILGPVNQAMENIPASESIRDADEVPVKGRHLKVLKRNALRLQHLVDQLLDLSKLDNGQMKLALSKGRMIEFIRAIAFSFESLAERKHIHFHTYFPAEPEEAWFDKDKLEKILANLLSNAFKFTPEQGAIRVRAEVEKGFLKLQVSDSGPGMDAEEIDKIFDRFYSLPPPLPMKDRDRRSKGVEWRNSSPLEGAGTGIGLSLVRELVELHGGQISVDSVKGLGATFKVTLPYQKGLLPATAILQEQTRSPGTVAPGIAHGLLEEEQELEENGQPDTAKPLALIVEDNPDLRRYIRENIGKDYQAILAEDGQQGLDLAIEKVPDIIISDVMMPRKNGFELCAALKTDSRTSHIPVILLTARAGQEHKIEGLEKGADAYLIKPFDVQELKVRMAKLIEQRRLLRERFSGELKLQPTQLSLSSMDERFLRSVMEQIEDNMGNEFYTVEDLARAVGFSRSQLHRKLKALADIPPNQLIRDFRLSRARELLEQKAGTVSEIAYQVGYSNLSYFSKSYKDAFGVSPSEM